MSISGQARFVEDRAKLPELWSPLYKAWFPKGLADPELQLMAVAAEEIEYCDSPSAPAVIFQGLKAAHTGRPQEMGCGIPYRRGAVLDRDSPAILRSEDRVIREVGDSPLPQRSRHS